jgi:hypothetical protein
MSLKIGSYNHALSARMGSSIKNCESNFFEPYNHSKETHNMKNYNRQL